MQQGDLILAIDGGGTKTIAWLAILDHQNAAKVIGRGKSGPSNCRSVGTAQATENLDRAIESAFQDAHRQRTSVASACFSLAGADRPVEKEEIDSWADKHEIADSLTITNDAIPVLYAASSVGVGIALISGTGSVAIGRNTEGVTARCGGWGGLLGDEGSGYQIALAGLKAAVSAADGRGPDTKLLSDILDHFKIEDASDLIPAIYGPQTNRSTIAKLAPIVFRAAESDDSVANSIVERAASDLSELVVTLASKLDLTEKSFMLAISGGVLLSQPTLVDKIRHRMADSGLKHVSVTSVQEPVAGALNIAMVK
jgi:N-acetylglucosamine kinase-like BadF-type ATPase